MSINDDTSNPTTVSYGGTVIARLDAGQIATLKTANREVEHDIIVSAGGGARKTISVSATAVDVASGHATINFSLTTNVEVTQ